MNCPICSTHSKLYFTNTKRDNKRYFRCPSCHTVAMHPQDYPNPEEEKARYLTHNNDTDDPGYQKFVYPVIKAVMTYTRSHHHGLDYGAGTGPVITKLLQLQGYSMTTYDPIFIPNSDALSVKYDFIVCCEVAEHFHDPQSEFDRFYQLLTPNGHLFIKTELLTSEIDFHNWYYKNDPTHTIFYSPNGIRHILNKYNLEPHDITPRLIVASKY